MSAITTEVPPFERASSTERVLECEELRVGYDGHALLPGVAFSLHTSQLWAIVGDNGSGKTTLLEFIANAASCMASRMWPGDLCPLRIARATLLVSVHARWRC